MSANRGPISRSEAHGLCVLEDGLRCVPVSLQGDEQPHSLDMAAGLAWRIERIVWWGLEGGKLFPVS
jgi:hypothetical protein